VIADALPLDSVQAQEAAHVLYVVQGSQVCPGVRPGGPVLAASPLAVGMGWQPRHTLPALPAKLYLDAAAEAVEGFKADYQLT